MHIERPLDLTKKEDRLIVIKTEYNSYGDTITKVTDFNCLKSQFIKSVQVLLSDSQKLTIFFTGGGSTTISLNKLLNKESVLKDLWEVNLLSEELYNLLR